MSWRRPLILMAGLVAVWQLTVLVADLPPYILPGPLPVANALFRRWPELMWHLLITGGEILLGLTLGTLLGCGCALGMFVMPLVRSWLLPVLVISQAVPVFALAPLLVLWLGYGMASKVMMAVLIIFFPVAASCYDGMRRVDPEVLELARIMGGSRRAILRWIVLPSALPAAASGLRVATAVALIGAVVGEWVGASAGLGYAMLHANARMQIDLMFAALALLAAMSLGLYFAVDGCLTRLVFWEKEKRYDENEM